MFILLLEKLDILLVFHWFANMHIVPNKTELLLFVACGDGYFECPSTGTCIPERFKCDGFAHCLDGADEHRSQCSKLMILNDVQTYYNDPYLWFILTEPIVA